MEKTVINSMDIIQLKDNSIIYSYKGGLKTSLCCDLFAIECDKPFIRLVFTNEKVLVRASMITIETRLEDYFVRISRQIIINMHHVFEYTWKNGSYWVYLVNGLEYKVSERRVKAVRSAFLMYTK